MFSQFTRVARFVSGAVSSVALGAVLAMGLAVPAHAASFSATLDCAAVAANASAEPQIRAGAGDTLTITFTNCFTGSTNSFYVQGGNGNGIFTNIDSVTGASYGGSASNWYIFNDATKTNDFVVNVTIMPTANNGSLTLGGPVQGNLIFIYRLPGGAMKFWNLAGVVTPPSLSPSSQSLSGTTGTSVTATTAITASGFTCTPAYSVDPALPSGLQLDATNGVISGTPTAVAASADYTITGACNSESAASVVTIDVAAPPAVPHLSGGVSNVSATAGQPLEPTAAIVANDFSCVPAFSVSPSLPDGVVIDSMTGSISGTPLGAIESTTYTVTAACDAESAMFDFTMDVAAASPVEEVVSSVTSLVNTGFSTVGPLGMTALLLVFGTPFVYLSSRFRRVRELGTVVLYRSAHLTIVAPARFFDSLRRRSRD